MSRSRKILLVACVVAALVAFLLASGALAKSPGWVVEPDAFPPSFAITRSIDTNLNVDSVVLICLHPRGGPARGLELDLYLSSDDLLLPRGADPAQLKIRASVEIDIDSQTFAAELLFGGDYVVVADTLYRDQPLLSARLLDAMQAGRTMVLRLDLLEETPDRPDRFDGSIVVDLEAAHEAIAAVRECAALPTRGTRR
jgi:hypothetical protein